MSKVDNVINKLFNREEEVMHFDEESKKIYIESLRKKIALAHKLKMNKNKREAINEGDSIVTLTPEIDVYDTLYTDVKIHYLKKVFSTDKILCKVKLKRSEAEDKIFIQKMN
jgi:uncharacterized protein (DUF342 family)